jgi:hypothetical protein
VKGFFRLPLTLSSELFLPFINVYLNDIVRLPEIFIPLHQCGLSTFPLVFSNVHMVALFTPSSQTQTFAFRPGRSISVDTTTVGPINDMRIFCMAVKDICSLFLALVLRELGLAYRKSARRGIAEVFYC